MIDNVHGKKDDLPSSISGCNRGKIILPLGASMVYTGHTVALFLTLFLVGKGILITQKRITTVIGNKHYIMNVFNSIYWAVGL